MHPWLTTEVPLSNEERMAQWRLRWLRWKIDLWWEALKHVSDND